MRLRETSGEKRVHVEVCNAENAVAATAYAKTKLEPTGLTLETLWEVDPHTGRRIQ